MLPETARQILAKYNRLTPCKIQEHQHALFYYPTSLPDLVEDALNCLHIPYIRLDPERHKLAPKPTYLICLECLDNSREDSQDSNIIVSPIIDNSQQDENYDEMFGTKTMSKEEALSKINVMDV